MKPTHPEAAVSTRHAWYALGVLMVVFMFSFIDRQILNLLVGPIRRDLHISDTQVGLLLGTSFALVYAVLGFPFGRLADTRSRRGLIALGLLVWSAATLLSGLARSYTQLLLARLGLAAGEASLAPAAYSLIADYFPEERRATAMGVYSMGIYLGSGLAFMLGGLVVTTVMKQGPVALWLLGTVQPWQLVLLLLGATSLLFTPVLFTLREPARASSHVVVPWAAVRRHWWQHRRTLACHHLSFACMSLSGYASSAWLPSYFWRIHGWETGRFAVLYGAIILVFCSAGAVCGGLWADRLRRQGQLDATMRVGFRAALASLPLGLLYLLPVTPSLAAALIAPAAFLLALPAGVAAAGLQQLMPPNLRGQSSALYLFVLNLVALGLGPTSVALLTDYWFADPKALGKSMLVVCGGAQLAAAVLLGLGLKPFRQSLARAAAA